MGRPYDDNPPPPVLLITLMWSVNGKRISCWYHCRQIELTFSLSSSDSAISRSLGRNGLTKRCGSAVMAIAHHPTGVHQGINNGLRGDLEEFY